MPAARSYPDSWYAYSSDLSAHQPILSYDTQADVCVIGGGFTGLSAAITLAEGGLNVVLLEANHIGWGASGRNGGQLIRGFVGDDKMARKLGSSYAEDMAYLKWAGHELIEERLETYSIECDYVRGWLEVAPTLRQFDSLKKAYVDNLANEADRGWRLLSKEELKGEIATEAYEGGLLSESDAHLHPLKLCLGLRDAALKLGVRIYEQSSVNSVETGKVATVRTEAGCVKAKKVVLAANAHHKLFSSQLGKYAYPAGSFIIATEQLGAKTLETLNPNGWAICDTKKVCDYYRMSSDGRILFGGRVNYSGNKPKSIQAALLPRLLKVWPELEGIKIDFEWGGKLAVPLSSVPVVGELYGNIYYAFGYTGHGVNTGNLLGKAVGDAILGKRRIYDMFAAMPKWGLPFGKCIGQQMVAAAIYGYKIKDRL